MFEGPRTDAPKTNREPAEVERKLSLLHQPHVAPLTEFVERLRAAKLKAAIPYFDPTEARLSKLPGCRVNTFGQIPLVRTPP